jgi:pyroglutamyl-peptidase
MATILLTGFEPFGKASLNPSGEIVKRISGENIVTAVLPVAYNSSATALLTLIEKHSPEIVIMLGQAEGRNQITPERIAINLDDAGIADNEGVLRTNEEIIEGGPVAYRSTLPVVEIVDALKVVDIPAAVSLSAGAFLCNHIFYIAQNRFEGSGVRSGFIHVPLMDEQGDEFPGLPTMPLDQLVKAVEIILKTL